MAEQRDYPPSFKQGFARSAAESEFPQLWRGLVGAWVPALGRCGDVLHDVCGRRRTAVAVGSSVAWTPSLIGPAVDLSGNYFSAAFPMPQGRIGIAATVYHKTVTGNTSLLGDASADNPRLNVHLPYNGTVYWDYGFTYSSGRISAAMPGDALNQWRSWVFNADAAANRMEILYGGALLQAGNCAAAVIPDGITLGLFGSLYWNSGIAAILIYNRAIDRAAARALAADPLAPFRLRRRVCGPALRRAYGAYRRVLASTYGVSQ
jgi:hypothetical protein